MNTTPRIIGLAGTPASGKDTLARYLVERCNYLHISTGDMLRAETQRRYGSIERPILHKHGEELRRQQGAGVLVEKALEQYRQQPQYQGVVITGLRSLGEAKTVIAAHGIVVFVDAPTAVRYERMRARHRDQEAMLSLDDFKAQEALEWHTGPGDADFNLQDIKALAAIRIENNKDTQTFLTEAVQSLGLQ